ncbi:hypothetical protein E4U09_006651 [Claviceps aff. purpurea]|uniref:Uncharacterized protein n=1 Tax=Claviceps aff. purpurea TaxID=1967640 RepID=A0A9P7QCE4_9HYPO|nr:hypothetical protein E4U09_006651 [Claviceps aff. purpurea]
MLYDRNVPDGNLHNPNGTHWNGVRSTGAIDQGIRLDCRILADKRQTWEKQNKPKTRQSSKKFQATIFEQASSKRLDRRRRRSRRFTKQTKQAKEWGEQPQRRLTRDSRVERTAFHLPVETTES